MSLTVANKYTPSTEYMKIINIMRLPMLTSPVSESKNVIKVLFKALFRLKR